jgi:hypothetical protein
MRDLKVQAATKIVPDQAADRRDRTKQTDTPRAQRCRAPAEAEDNKASPARGQARDTLRRPRVVVDSRSLRTAAERTPPGARAGLGAGRGGGDVRVRRREDGSWSRSCVFCWRRRYRGRGRADSAQGRCWCCCPRGKMMTGLGTLARSREGRCRNGEEGEGEGEDDAAQTLFLLFSGIAVLPAACWVLVLGLARLPR